MLWLTSSGGEGLPETSPPRSVPVTCGKVTAVQMEGSLSSTGFPVPNLLWRNPKDVSTPVAARLYVKTQCYWPGVHTKSHVLSHPH